VEVILQPEDAGGDVLRARRHSVSPNHFRTLGIPLLEGRDFTSNDTPSQPRVAIISQRLARRYWGTNGLPSSPSARRLRAFGRSYDIVGVVGDVQHMRLLEPATVEPDVYFSFAQEPIRDFSVVARVEGNTQLIVDEIRNAVRRLHSAAPFYDIRTGDDMFGAQLTLHRFSGALLVAFALVALALTIVGIHGMVAYAAARQTREVGIRLALGATRSQILQLVVSAGLRPVAVGLVAGTLAAIGLTRLLASLIYGVTATDPLTFTIVIAGLALVGGAACGLPARRASALDPTVALRAE
jgi:hypothetical protein